MEIKLWVSFFFLLEENEALLLDEDPMWPLQQNQPIACRRTRGCLSIVLKRSIVQEARQTSSGFAEPFLNAVKIGY